MLELYDNVMVLSGPLKNKVAIFIDIKKDLIDEKAQISNEIAAVVRVLTPFDEIFNLGYIEVVCSFDELAIKQGTKWVRLSKQFKVNA